MPDVLAPGVVRVDTDTDQTPIGTCWGRDLPEGWQWRRQHGRLFREPDYPRPPADEWVQCRPPATKTPSQTLAEDADAILRATKFGDELFNGWGETLPVVVAVLDALNAAESSTTPSEPDENDATDAEVAQMWHEAQRVTVARSPFVQTSTNASTVDLASSPVVDREPEEPTPDEVLRQARAWTWGRDVENDLTALMIQRLVRLIDSMPKSSMSPVPQPDPGQETS